MFRLLAAALVAVFAFLGYCSMEETNPVTGEDQHVALSAEQEVALGLQAAPRLSEQYGGPEPDQEAQALVDRIGGRIVAETAAGETPYQFEFHVLDDDETLNAFALPGGQIFVTMGLVRAFESEAQLAGVLAHEVGHVVARHSAEQLAKQQLAQGLAGATTIATYDPGNPGTAATGAIAAAIAQLVDMRFSREDELEADELGVRLLRGAGYDPAGLMSALDVLSRDAAGVPEFFSTHPNPENRATRLRAVIESDPEAL